MWPQLHALDKEANGKATWAQSSKKKDGSYSASYVAFYSTLSLDMLQKKNEHMHNEIMRQEEEMSFILTIPRGKIDFFFKPPRSHREANY